jgi:ATP-dependent helicase/nuclease subunit A
VTTSQVAPGWRVEGEELSLAADKGTAIHEAMRILLLRPDLAHRVAAHCRLSKADVTALEQQAQGLSEGARRDGLPRIARRTAPRNCTERWRHARTAIIDLIAEGPDGYLIVDHKSGAVDNHAERIADLLAAACSLRGCCRSGRQKSQ